MRATREQFFLWVLAFGLAACGSEDGDDPGDPYVGRWQGTWFAEAKGEATGVVKRVECGGYQLEVHDADGDVVTWLDGELGEDGLEFTVADDAPDRYLSKWRAFIPKDGGVMVGQSYPAREFGGFEMRKAIKGEE